MTSPIILAVDTPDIELAKRWISATRESIDIFKLGLEFYLSHGYEGIASIQQETGAEIFLDLKLHDIPHTVSKAASVVASLKPRFLTVHASGGAAMIAGAVEAVSTTSITAVTILTSLSEEDLSEIGFQGTALSAAQGLAAVAVKAGATSIVCSPHEISGIRQRVGDSVTIITPGVRPADENSGDDQKRTMTPVEAMSLGANFLVIGRPITSRWVDGPATMAERAAEILASVQR
jgi:orotidine-5'-phosphate decarboxylase